MFAEAPTTSHSGGSAGTATRDAIARVYDDLRAFAQHALRRDFREQTLTATAVVHEAFIRLAVQNTGDWPNRSRFVAVACIMIRRVLVDHARRRRTADRAIRHARPPAQAIADNPPGGVDLVALDAALRRLETLHPRQARVVELRYFGGLNIEEAADVLGVSAGTVVADWRLARAWLRDRLDG